MDYNTEFQKEIEKKAKEISNLDDLDEIGRKGHEIGLLAIASALEALDDAIYKSEKRKKEYESKGKEERVLVSLHGKIRFKRRRYVEKKGKKHLYLLDIVLSLKKRGRYSEGVMKKAIENALEMKSYKQAGEKTLGNIDIVIGKSTIYNWLKKCVFKEKESKQREAETITISADGTYPHIKKDSISIKELKVFNLYDSREKIEKEKYRINSLIYCPKRQGSITRTWEHVLEFIERKYDVSKIKKVYICGDGANWIKNIMKEDSKIKQSWIKEIDKEFVIDKFHYIKTYCDLMKYGYELKDLINYYENGDLTPFKDKEEAIKILKRKEIRNKVEYLKTNEENTKGWDKEGYLGCDMEMVMSHYICPRFKGSPKVWGKNIFKYGYGLALLKNNLLEIELEGEEEKDYIEDIKMKFKNVELYYGDFKEKGNLDSVLYGRDSGLRRLFSNLAHSY